MERLITKKEREEVVEYCFDIDWPFIEMLSNSDYVKIRNTLGFHGWKIRKEFKNLGTAIKKEFYAIFGK